VSSGVIAINAAQVGNFGEFEYWFALIKVIAIIAFIVVGVALILGIAHRPAIAFRNLTAYGGFMPHGLRGMWLALTIAISSYMGVEVIAVTAGEAPATRESDPACNAHHCFPAHPFLCPGCRRDGHHVPLEPE
jgi:L-asparagine transporter-like permease